MTKTIVVCGFGPGVSDAVAHKFGRAGFQVALVARREQSLSEGVARLQSQGITAKGFACDLGNDEEVRTMISKVRTELGPVTVLHWNVYAALAGDLTDASTADLDTVFRVGVSGMVAAVQAALPDMREQEQAAVLVTGGGFAFYDEKIDQMIVQWRAMGLGVVKAAQHKLVGLLHHKLAPEGIYVGEVLVLGAVKGTALDSGQATIDPKDIGEAFWKLYEERSEVSRPFSG